MTDKGIIFYPHYSQIKAGDWKWVYFKPWEIASPDDGSIAVNVNALNMLDLLRRTINKPIILNSAYRSLSHNIKVRGASNSYHRLGAAFDIKKQGHDVKNLIATAQKIGFHGIGVYNTFIHIDTRKRPTRWGNEIT